MIPRRRDNGSILVVTLWMVTLVSLFTLGLITTNRIAVRVEKNMDTAGTVRQWLYTASEMAAHRVRLDEETDFDSLNEGWAEPSEFTSQAFEAPRNPGAPDLQLILRVVDESGKINVNLASEDVLTEALRLAGAGAHASQIASAIVDWRDPDNDGPAENALYEQQDPRYAAANKDLRFLEELLFVDGVSSALYFGEDANRNGALDPEEDDGDVYLPLDNGDGDLQPGLLDVFTVYSDGPLNVNTASALTLRAILRTETTPSEADRLSGKILAHRTGADRQDGSDDDQPFTSEEEFAGAFPVVYEHLLRAGVQAGVESTARRYLIRVHDRATGYLMEGEAVFRLEDDRWTVAEWHEK